MKVAILVLERCTPLTSIGSLEILAKSAALHDRPDGAPFFSLSLVSVRPGPVETAAGYPVYCHATIDESLEPDLVIVPALDGDVLGQLERNRPAVDWVRRMYSAGADVVSLCTGAFVLAEAGLLDGRTATTHWAAESLFRSRYPRVDLQPARIIVDGGRICTGGGATSFLTVMVYLVEKYCGAETARLAARMFLIDLNKEPQTAYAIFAPQKGHGDQQILRAQILAEGHTGSPLTVQALADAAGISRRHFVRRFKEATGNTPQEYLQRVRVEAAKRELERSTIPFARIAESMGYEDLGSFRRLFARVTGVSPSEYRRRYGTGASWGKSSRSPALRASAAAEGS
jgi:transcriptional regulator GlxA family with amidase domain